MRFRTVLFDLDGTLIDHLPAIHRSYCHTLPRLGLPAPSYEDVRRAIGGGLENTMRAFVSEGRLPEALGIYRSYWDRTMLDGVSLMPGAREVLEALRSHGIATAVWTNKHGPSSRRICSHLGISSLLNGVFGAGDTAWLKPQTEFAAHVLKELQADLASTCLVGDSPFDIAAAAAAGLAFAGVATGSHSTAELRAAGAQRVEADLPELARRWRLPVPPRGL